MPSICTSAGTPPAADAPVAGSGVSAWYCIPFRRSTTPPANSLPTTWLTVSTSTAGFRLPRTWNGFAAEITPVVCRATAGSLATRTAPNSRESFPSAALPTWISPTVPPTDMTKSVR